MVLAQVCVWLRSKVLGWSGPGQVGFKRKRFGPIRWVTVEFGRAIITFRRFQSARRISTFYTSTESFRQVDNDEPTFRAIKGLKVIGDFISRHSRGAGPTTIIFDLPVESRSSIYGREGLGEWAAMRQLLG